LKKEIEMQVDDEEKIPIKQMTKLMKQEREGTKKKTIYYESGSEKS
jgi:hypothetical protein